MNKRCKLMSSDKKLFEKIGKLLFLYAMEELKTVFAEIPKEDKGKVESILKVFTLTFSDVVIKDLEFDEVERNYLVSLRISPKYYKTLIEKLTLNNVKVLTDDPEAENVINYAQKRLNKKETRGFDGWDSQVRIGKPKRSAPIEQIAADGDYLELIRVINDFSAPSEKRDRAKEMLETAVNNAMKKSYEQSLANPRLVDDSIRNLLNIATDGFLKAIGHSSLTQHAAQIAMDIALSDPAYYEKLVLMGNDRYLTPLINLKAIIAFTEKTFPDKNKYRAQIKFARRYSNLKWLVKAYEEAKDKLNPDERKLLKTYVTYINQSRTRV